MNQKLKVGAIFMDNLKAFDTLYYSLLLANLDARGFDNNLLSFVQRYLTKRFSRCKIKNDFKSWQEIKTGVPQGTIFEPLLFNIFINKIFLFLESSNVCNCADNNNLFGTAKSFIKLPEILK